MEATCDIAVVGAGAAGLAAGIFAAEHASRSLRIVVLDGAAKLGAKILISGGGRCNVTHDEVTASDFNGSRPVIRNILAAFDAQATVRWFGDMNVQLKREATGKLFPVTDRARTVLDALLRRCAELQVDVVPDHRVEDVIALANDVGFDVTHARGRLRARRVILATGGRSLPRTGSDGGGWEIAQRLGHSVTATYPALVPLVLEDSFHADLSGVSQMVELSTFADGGRIDRRTGSLLWTHFGISGPVVMDASRHWVIARATRQQAEMRCNFLPGNTFEDVERWLVEANTQRPRVSVGRLLAERLPARLAPALARAAESDPSVAVGQLSRAHRRHLIHTLTAFTPSVVGDRGWDHAEVTAGGVPVDEIDYRTMESRCAPGLHLVGEMLDCDGRIGGFNFQWAWATGYIAGRNAARDF